MMRCQVSKVIVAMPTENISETVGPITNDQNHQSTIGQRVFGRGEGAHAVIGPTLP